MISDKRHARHNKQSNATLLLMLLNQFILFDIYQHIFVEQRNYLYMIYAVFCI